MTGQATADDKNIAKDASESNTQGFKKQWRASKQGQSKFQNNKATKFKGEISELNGHVYEVHSETAKANQYQKTTKAISAYVNRTLKSGNDMMNMIDNMEDIDFNLLKPKAVEGSDDEVDRMILQQEVNDFVKRRKLYYENRDKVYTIVWGQCSQALQAKLKGTVAFRTYNPIKCPISLLKDIKQVSLKFENVTFKIQRTAVTTHTRDSTAKDSILPDITDANILPPAPEANRPATDRYNLRPKTLPKYAIDCMCYAKHGIALTGFTMAWACTQMTAKEGLKRFGKDAEDALLIEWKQLDRLKVYSGVHWNDLTPEERSRALRLVQLLKLKRCGRLRGRTCADGRKQKKYILPEDASSPTVSTEALLMTCVIDAKERRCVATADVPGAFLHADMDDVVHVIVEGEQLQLLIKSNPAYKMFVHTDKRTGKERAYLRLHKALYGTLKAARLFYEDLSGHLEDMGFEANPYDPCVMNRNIQGSQCTVAWHVDDLKISHKSQAIVDRMLKRLSDIYGDLSITRGSKHTFVGMDLEFKNGEVTVGMESYLHESIEAFPEEINKKVNSPAASHLYNINPDAKKLPEHMREIFHSVVAKLLFVATRGRPDLQPTISFLTSRCHCADVDDWKKLKRLLCYIKDTIKLRLRLKANAMNIVMWWADAAFAVRDDFKSQSGRGMSLGTGMIQCKSNKQTTTENSSTTAELIASSDALVMIMYGQLIF
jgi:ABC-type transport system involved in cytochrome bd biosynthesis, ATPase and permease components